ncbi:tripartite tricarboxylate transporter substrate binding protein [Nitratireductor kimnyeongensis]|uniref:Tripartite tricarboxylate transporter substrate binding protein n=1 Tax=Nitratireductor kimnyeongensis TaxID=430679 RepID=A0ABW0T769_9HYPH|nr:tripartite tricarboxylate transporter substrate binding protein [Nitratireductor kimnyeongensis]QZZ34395.1 tripartite tricarboxylate transporter substrate binding protein [Nitratireductor kimnyeongensis]
MTFKPLALIAAMAIGIAATPAVAEYPDRQIKLIVPFSAGGGTDLNARTVAQFLEKELGEPVVVVNRPGAGGEIGLSELASSDPDGYTIGIINTPGIITIPIEREAQFSLESFDFLAAMAEDPGTINVLGSSDIGSIEDLVAAAKEKPGRVTVATQGAGSAGHINTLLLEQAAGIDLLPIPFDGSSAGRNALLSGEIMATTANLGEALTFSEGTDWRILGVMADEASPMASDVPTFASAGYPVIGGSLRGIGAPAGLPDEVREKLEDALKKVSDDPEYLKIAKQANLPARFIPSDRYVSILEGLDKSFHELWETTPWNQ